MASRTSLIVGLGNPGPKYERTRHNAGFWFVDYLAQHAGVRLKLETKFHGELGKLDVEGNDVWLLKPNTFMNRSGQAVRAVAQFYRIETPNVIVAHDELDIPVGTIRLKQGGGHGGHNGLRDIIDQLGGNDFARIRLGIGRPTAGGDVTNYLLNETPPAAERTLLDDMIKDTAVYVPQLVSGEFHKAMQHLHSRTLPSTSE